MTGPHTQPPIETIESLTGLMVDPAARTSLSAAGKRPAVLVRIKGEGTWPSARLKESLSRPPILIGLDETGTAPQGWAGLFDVLLTNALEAGREWVRTNDPVAEAGTLHDRVMDGPLAAATFAQVLRLGQRLSFDEALVLESLGYSTLLAGSEFQRWRTMNPPREPGATSASPLVLIERDCNTLNIRLNRPQSHNALNAALRNELLAAFQLAVADTSIDRIVLSGEGPSFSSGGDLDEFGTATDQGFAHTVRVAVSVAALVHRCAGRVEARLHGACLGAGIEIPAAAGRVTATPDTRFGLPESGMGLIPGAGGTVTLPRRIGRHRTCWLGLSGAHLDAETALDWGLIDAIEERNPG